MNFTQLISAADIEEAPDRSPHDAFCFLVTRADERLTDFLRSCNTDEDGWQEHTDAKYCFMNGATALAKKFGIDAFATHEMPSV